MAKLGKGIALVTGALSGIVRLRRSGWSSMGSTSTSPSFMDRGLASAPTKEPPNLEAIA